jgi:hypothetical protein
MTDSAIDTSAEIGKKDSLPFTPDCPPSFFPSSWISVKLMSEALAESKLSSTLDSKNEKEAT